MAYTKKIDGMGTEMKRLWFTLGLLISFVGITVYAGDGVADAYLSMESSSVEDGAKEVPLNFEIAMKYSNNVVNMKVYDNNLTAFSLYDSKDNEVAIEVVMGDDQIDRTIKNDIIVKSIDPLEEGENYRLVISENLMSKNGNNMLEDITINFKTEGESGSGTNPAVWIAIGTAVFAGSFVAIQGSKKKA